MKGLQKAFAQSHGGDTEFWRVTEMLMNADGSGHFTRSGWVSETEYDADDVAEVKAKQSFVLADVSTLHPQVMSYGFTRLAALTEFSGGTLSGTVPTIALLHFNGNDASQIFTDSSPNARTVTAVGAAQLDTAQKYFGTSSLLCDGVSSAARIAHDADFDVGTGDFTIDLMVRFAALPTGGNSFALFHLGTTSIGISTDDVVYYLDVQLAGGTVHHYEATGLTTDTWYYIGVTRTSGMLYMVFNGSLVTPALEDLGNITGDVPLVIGDVEGGGAPHNGWIDEVRYSNTSIGLAIPVAEYSTSGEGYTYMTSTQALNTGRDATHWIVSKVFVDEVSDLGFIERKGYLNQTEYDAGSDPLVTAKEEFTPSSNATLLNDIVQAGLEYLQTLASPDYTDATEIPSFEGVEVTFSGVTACCAVNGTQDKPSSATMAAINATHQLTETSPGSNTWQKDFGSWITADIDTYTSGSCGGDVVSTAQVNLRVTVTFDGVDTWNVSIDNDGAYSIYWFYNSVGTVGTSAGATVASEMTGCDLGGFATYSDGGTATVVVV